MYQRARLPCAVDRLRLGETNLTANPSSIGITESTGTIAAAYEAGINFFFILGDCRWPLYAPIRELLGPAPPCRRDEPRPVVCAEAASKPVEGPRTLISITAL